MENLNDIKFYSLSDFPDIEWIGDHYNIEFRGKRKDRNGLRKRLISQMGRLASEKQIPYSGCVEQLTAFTTDQLIGLAVGSTIDEVLGTETFDDFGKSDAGKIIYVDFVRGVRVA